MRFMLMIIFDKRQQNRIGIRTHSRCQLIIIIAHKQSTIRSIHMAHYITWLQSIIILLLNVYICSKTNLDSL